MSLAPPGFTELPVRVRGCCQTLPDPLPQARSAELAEVFRALDDPTRIRMIHILAQATEPVCVCDFTATFDLGQPTISHHLARLREAGLVSSFRRGLWSFHQLDPEMPAAARAAVQLIRSAAS